MRDPNNMILEWLLVRWLLLNGCFWPLILIRLPKEKQKRIKIESKSSSLISSVSLPIKISVIAF